MEKIKAWVKNNWQKTWLLILVLTILAFILRVYQIAKIKDQIFDEIYFVEFAKNYLSGKEFFDIHPPLGKLIIALGIKIFGDTPFGWRILPALFGTLLIPLVYLTGKELGNRKIGILAALVVFLDGMLLVYSRLGLMDIFLSFFLLAAFWAFIKFANQPKIPYLLIAGLLTGLAASVKYSGFLILAVFVVIIFVKKVSLKKYIIPLILGLVILPLVIYLSFFFFNFHGTDFFSRVYQWHYQSINYNLTLKDSHPYGSKWWTWFLLMRPIWLYFQTVGDKYVGVVGLGNPLAWWSSLVVLPWLIWGIFKKEWNLLLILSAFLVFLLPWIFVKRVIFIYHALPSFVFLSFGIAFLLDKLLSYRYGQYLVSAYFIVLLALFIFFLPLWLGQPLSSASFYHRIWFKGWI